MEEVAHELQLRGHNVLLPEKVPGVDYWADGCSERPEAKRELDLINKHLHKIKESDAILVVNATTGDIVHYIGANTFLEMAFAYHWKKKIFVLNNLSNQPYINDEIQAFDCVVLENDLSKII